MRAAARVPLSNPPWPWSPGVEPRPALIFYCRASRAAFAPPLREPQREQWRARRVGGASGPAGRLEDVQKVLTSAPRAAQTTGTALNEAAVISQEPGDSVHLVEAVVAPAQAGRVEAMSNRGSRRLPAI